MLDKCSIRALFAGGARMFNRALPMMVSTTNDVTGFKIVRHFGIVRGITVRSRSVVGNFVGGLQSMFGGQIGAYVELAETARQESFDHMCAHATQAGANAVVGMRYDANGSWRELPKSSPMAGRCGSSRTPDDRKPPEPVIEI
jgi:uncharacterized protein YbjQ (UPF0145 family)